MKCPECGKEMIQPHIYNPGELYAWCKCGYCQERKPKTKEEFEKERLEFYKAIEDIGITDNQKIDLYNMFTKAQL